MKRISIFTLFLLLSCYISAQNPFAQYGYTKVKIATMTNGRYNEFFDNDTIMQIGSVVINTNTGKIVSFIEKTDTTYILPEPQIMSRWISPDPLAEKYYHINPYAYCANNPILFVDPNGDSINVSEANRQAFNNDMQKIYGDNAKSFSFNNTGMLVFSGDIKNLTKEQQSVFEGQNKLMSEATTTNVVYGESYTVGSGKDATTYKTSEFGGALTAKDVNINGQKQNLIVISPTISDVKVSLDGVMDILSNKQADVKQNTTTGLFHELGEAITTDINFRGGVIDYENKARVIIGLPNRPYDLNHSKTVKTIYKKK